MKHCNKCDIDKPIEEFGKNKRSSDGLQYYCKECCRIAAKRYRQRPEVKKRQLEYQKQYVREYSQRPEVKDRTRKRVREKYRNDPSVRERQAEWAKEYNKRPEVRKRKRQRWRERYTNDPEFRANHIRRYNERRARIMGVSAKDRQDTTAYMIVLEGMACYYCGKAEGMFHIDHVQPLARKGSHLWYNIVNACDYCNLSKNAKTYEEFAGKVDIRHYCMQGV